ncbi:MAG: AAA family ATPase, partial [Verrucomicrobiales bacterium]
MRREQPRVAPASQEGTVIDEVTIRQLADPAAFPDAADEVVQYQTHLSLVCVVGDVAYKLKKAVRLPFVDLSSLPNRERCCNEEVRLNRRLCPDTYLGVVPLYARSGKVSFCGEGGGEIVDYAVKMRRLPDDRMMDVMLGRNAVTRAEVENIAVAIASFHRERALQGTSDEARRATSRLREFAFANFDETAALCGSVFDGALHHTMRCRNEADFDRWDSLLEARAGDGRVVDGHGDLHARNICLGNPIAIYDCLEFSRELRVADAAAENAFLLMDLHYRGQRDLATAYLDRYLSITGDVGQRELLPMLIRYRAMVRAKVAAIAAGEHEIAEAERAAYTSSARRHLNLMATTAIEEGAPCLICACGLPASGKSFVFDALASVSGWPCHATDRIRKELAGIPPHQRAPQESYTPEASERTYSEAMRRAADSLRCGPALIDANFANTAFRDQAREVARDAGAQIVFVWFQVDDREVELR